MPTQIIQRCLRATIKNSIWKHSMMSLIWPKCYEILPELFGEKCCNMAQEVLDWICIWIDQTGSLHIKLSTIVCWFPQLVQCPSDKSTLLTSLPEVRKVWVLLLQSKLHESYPIYGGLSFSFGPTFLSTDHKDIQLKTYAPSDIPKFSQIIVGSWYKVIFILRRPFDTWYPASMWRKTPNHHWCI